MDGDERRKQMEEILKQSAQPISGTALAKQLGVSRQVVVQDIALLRAVNKNILSTNKGYLLFHSEEQIGKATRIIKVSHTNERILDELNTIVDYGGKVADVIVEHPIYGQITVDLIIHSRADAANFMEEVEKYKTKPLNELTNGVHYHTITADSQERLDQIEEVLNQKGYLIK